jgi:hypothetical protein
MMKKEFIVSVTRWGGKNQEQDMNSVENDLARLDLIV